MCEDFAVKEIPNYTITEKGEYPVFLLIKRDYTTEQAIQKIADYYNIKQKFIGYAGIKDKKAVTEQYLSINISKREFDDAVFQDIELKRVGYADEPIYIGRLLGNQFLILIRNLTEADIAHLKKKIVKPILVPNLFGEQRFSKNNIEIGQAIIKKDFEKAVSLILESNHKLEQPLREYIQMHPNDFVGAIRKLPLKISKLFIHSLQSKLFNRFAIEFLQKYPDSKNMKIPVIGFGTEFDDKNIEKIYNKIMQDECITEREFIIRGIPELSSEGHERDLFVEVNDFKVISASKDELNEDHKKIKVSFYLSKGSYATVVVDYLMRK
jgi:tRNA pseudouridine13 synthase